jgi:Big-like domain-containing protein/FIMAH domain-containing protein
MKRAVTTTLWVAALCVAAMFALTPTAAQAQTCAGPAAEIISPTPGSTLQADGAGFVTFTWCNASADYFVIIETVPGAHDIFFAFTGGAGGGAGQNFLSLPIVSSLPNPSCASTPPIGCIPAQGETIIFTLDTVKSKQLLGSFQYTFTAPSAPAPPAATTTTVDNKSVTASAVDQTVTLTATIAAASPVNQGTVIFQVMNGATNVGTSVTSAALTSGSASVTYVLPGGTAAQDYTIKADYSGGANFASSSGTGILTVNPAPSIQEPTTTTVGDQSVTFSAAVQNVTLTATVAAASTVNEGTVTFQVKDGAVNVGTAVSSATLIGGNASVIYALPAGLVAGNYTIQATYSGGTSFLGSSGSGNLTVSQAPPPAQTATTTTVGNASTTFSSNVQQVTLSAAVSVPGGASTVAEGTVTFQVMDGATNIGAAVPSAPLTNGLASVSYGLPAGQGAKAYTIQATYSGGTSFLPSSSTATLSIAAAPSTTSFTSTAPASLALGGTYRPTATSTGDGTLTIGASGSCSIASGVVTMTASAGVCTVTATESAGPNFQGSSATPQVIQATTPTITISTIKAHVASLHLNKRNTNSLTRKLDKAQASLDRGNPGAATKQLLAFINKVRAMQHSGRLDAATAASLIAEAMVVIKNIGG